MRLWRLLSVRSVLAPCEKRPVQLSTPPLQHFIQTVKYSNAVFNEVTSDKNQVSKYVEFSKDHTEETAQSFIQSFRLLTDFITKEEEELMYREVDKELKRHPFEKDHWDEVGPQSSKLSFNLNRSFIFFSGNNKFPGNRTKTLE